MKTRILLLLMFSTLITPPLLLKGEDEVFPKSDAIWAIHVYDFPYDKLYVYGLRGDTIINDKEYQKLYFLNDTTFSADGKDIYVAGIRQESKKVWIQPNGFKSYQEKEPWSEYLLYDFSKKIGEKIDFLPGISVAVDYYRAPTFETEYYHEYNYSFVIKNIEQTPYRKMFSFTDERASPWLEGIGSLAGLWFYDELRFSLGYDNAHGSFLRCMKVEDSIIYLDNNLEEKVEDQSDCITCFGKYFDPQNIEEEAESNINVIFSSENKTVEIISTSNLSCSSLDVISIDGVLLKTILLRDTNYILDISDLKDGIYLYRLRDGCTMRSGKVLIY